MLNSKQTFNKAIAIIFVLCLMLNESFAQSFIKEVKINKCVKPPDLDGVDNDDCWQKCQKLENFQSYPLQGLASHQTIGKVTYDDKNLYVFIIISEPLFSEPIAGTDNKIDSNEIFKDDIVELFIWPSELHEKYVQIVFNSKNSCTDILWDLNTSKPNYEWSSETEFAIGKIKGFSGGWTVEMAIPLLKIDAVEKIEHSIRFNIGRERIGRIIENKKPFDKQKEKQNKSNKSPNLESETKILEPFEDSAWSPSGKNFQNPLTFGKLIGEKGNVKWESDLIDIENNLILNGAASLVASMDVYFKGTNEFDQFIPEGCEVTNGSCLTQCDHIPVAQYMSKADGYMRVYLKTGIKEYLSLSDQIVSKIIKAYEATTAKDGTHWFPLISLVDLNGVAHGYDNGPQNDRIVPNSILWDQSKATVTTKGNIFGDAFGLGMYELSKNASSFPVEYKTKLLNICKIYLEFYHRDYVLFDEQDKYYWRTDDFSPLNPKMPIPPPDWGFMGQDIVYMIMAYLNLESADQEKYHLSLEKFIKFYMKNRNHFSTIDPLERYTRSSPIWRIEFLDNRMLALAEFLINKKKLGGNELKKFIINFSVQFYSEAPPTRTCLNGETSTSTSTAPMLEIFRRTNKDNFKILWQNFTQFDIGKNGFSYKGLKPPAINFSSYPVFLDYGFNAWKDRLITDQEFSRITRRFYVLFGNPKFLRNNESWCSDLTPQDKLLPEWQAMPGRCYVENVMPEGIWENGEAQGYTTIWPGAVGMDPDIKYRKLLLERNVYHQFCAPFQSHATPFSYGNAFDYNLLYTNINSDLLEKDLKEVFVHCKKGNSLPANLPCYGVIDVTDAYYEQKSFKKPTYNQAVKITLNNKSIPFKVIKILEYYQDGSPIDNVKIVFVVPEIGENEYQLKVVFEKNKKIY